MNGQKSQSVQFVFRVTESLVACLGQIVELGSTSTSKEQQCKVKANGAKRAEARKNAENEKTKGQETKTISN